LINFIFTLITERGISEFMYKFSYILSCLLVQETRRKNSDLPQVTDKPPTCQK